MPQPTKKETWWVNRLTPNCGVTGVLMLAGCVATICFTATKNWTAVEFTLAFTSIMAGGKGMKILDKKFGGRK